MPNWCFTDIDFKGKAAHVIFLYSKIKEWTEENQTENGFGLNWLGNIVIGSGIATAETIDDKTTPRCRGAIVYDSLNMIDNVPTLSIQTETAWVPMIRMWQKIIDKYDLGLEIKYVSTEPGCEVFWTNDKEYVGKYVVDLFESEFEEIILRKTGINVYDYYFTEEEKDKIVDALMDEVDDIYDVVSINQMEYVSISETDW